MPIAMPLDLGTRSLATAEVADAMGICDGAGATGTGTGTDPGTATQIATLPGTADADGSSTNDTAPRDQRDRGQHDDGTLTGSSDGGSSGGTPETASTRSGRWCFPERGA